MKNRGFLALLILTASLLLLPGSCAAQYEEINSQLVQDPNSSLYAQFPKSRSLGIKWDKYPVGEVGTPATPLTISGMLDGIVTEPMYAALASVTDPTVVSYDGGYRMWYTLIVTRDGESGLYTDYSIRCADSPEGRAWNDITTVNNVPAKQEESAGGTRVCSLVVLKESPDPNRVHYRMWYLGKKDKSNSPEGANSDRWTLYYADSIDGGRTWQAGYLGGLYKALDSTPRQFDEFSIKRASVLAERNSEGEIEQFKMWYSGINNFKKGGIGYAYSTSGTEAGWQKQYGVMGAGFADKHYFDSLSVEYPHVIYDEGVYKMWYSGYTTPWAIGLAYSLDGKTFDYYDNQFEGGDNSPVLKPEVYWEDKGVMNCHIIRETDDEGDPLYKMWYVGKGKDNVYKIGYAESVKREL